MLGVFAVEVGHPMRVAKDLEQTSSMSKSQGEGLFFETYRSFMRIK